MAHGYFQQSMTPEQAEIFKALDFLQIPGTYTITSSEDVYFFPEPHSPELHESFQDEASKLHDAFIGKEMRPVIIRYLLKHGIIDNDESIMSALNRKVQFNFEMTPEFIDELSTCQAKLTLQMDELANDIFGGKVLTSKQILAATAVGRKAARDILHIEDDPAPTEDERTRGAGIIASIID